ncbi:MAG: transposase [Lachnospiraceae bacterium]|nr:transposase [Lachnospiraceae bacterium]
MYLDFLVNIPISTGKITYRKKGETDYVYYEYKRIYTKGSNITNPKRVTIGKRDKTDPSMMLPNENYLKYFPDEDLPEINERTKRSSCLRIGAWLVIRKIMDEYRFTDILEKYVSKKDLGLVLDLAAYSIISENNAGQYYPDYAYNHPLFSNEMHIYSDSRVSDLLQSMTTEMSAGFLNDWNSARDHREKIYISYDSTNKNCQAGELEIVEYGHAKVDTGAPIFNYSIAYDTQNKEPLFYEEYSGSINDVSQLEFMIGKAAGYGYKKIGFILDRGYFSRGNINCMDKYGYHFVIMVKGMNKLVNSLILEMKGSFENKWAQHIDDYDVYGTTIKRKLYETDTKERYFHLFHSSAKEGEERALLAKKLRKMKAHLMQHTNEVIEFSSGFKHYYRLHYNEQNGAFQFPEDRTDVIELENDLSGYFCIITSEKMTAKEALNLYKSRDTSEKLFRGDKSYLGDKSLRIYGDTAAESKIFIEFLALIVRNRMYNCLKDERLTLDSRPNYMTVPAAIRELEKIEMVRLTDNRYRLDHAVTATQKTILKAFGMDAPLVKCHAEEISKILEGVK